MQTLKFLVGIILPLCFIQFVKASKNSNIQHNNPHFVQGRSAIVHLFEWKWLDVANECENFLAPNGFGGVQVSPVNENVIIKNRPWWERYQPISYLLKTRSGNENEFFNMTTRCNKVGVRIYVDVVFNHMAADEPEKTVIGTGGSKAVPVSRDYPGVPYKTDNFHPPCEILNYNDKYQVRNCELVGLHDLNQTIEDTRLRIVDFLNHLVDLGVAGFRVDAAKHMWPADLEIIYGRVKTLNTTYGFNEGSAPFIIQEVIDLGGEGVSKYEYNSMGTVTEFRYSMELGKSFQGHNPLRWLKNFGEAWSFLPSEDALVFIDNHDNQRSGGDEILTFKKPKNYKMAQIFSLSFPFGHKRIMSSFAFSSTDQGPPADQNGELLSPIVNGSCGNGFVCEHRWPEIYSMVEFQNVVQGNPVSNWWDNNNNQIAFSRGNRGFVVFNMEGDMNSVKIPTSLPSGIYCDVITGEKLKGICTGKTIKVTDGIVSITLPQNDVNGVIAIHEQSKLSRFDYLHHYKVTENVN